MKLKKRQFWTQHTPADGRNEKIIRYRLEGSFVSFVTSRRNGRRRFDGLANREKEGKTDIEGTKKVHEKGKEQDQIKI